jgi:two-component system sensor histidine kinase QseC
VVADLAPQALAKGQAIELDAPAACLVQADATLLAVLVRNLVDNAVRYSPAQAAVKVTLSHDASRTWLCVEDSGPGLSEPDLQQLGERFFRVLGSGQGGSGLGWSIVRRIAAVHRAEVRAIRSVALGGLQVVVEWSGL